MIRLYVNQIAPDVYDKKFFQLREAIFGNYKFEGEKGYKKDQGELQINEQNLKDVVEVIFKKAQNEKDYCSFYGQLVEDLIKLELRLKG